MQDAPQDTIGRRHLLRGAAVAALPVPALGQTYANGAIRLVIGFGAGGFADITVRLVGERLARRRGQQVVVDSRPGAGGSVAARFAAARGAIEDGVLRPVASSGERRSALLPEVPTLRETGLSDYAVTGCDALFAPAATPVAIISLLNGHVGAILAMPDLRQRITGLGVEPMHNTPERMGALLRQDIATWARVIESAGVEKQ